MESLWCLHFMVWIHSDVYTLWCGFTLMWTVTLCCGFTLIFSHYKYFILYCRRQRVHLPIISAPRTWDPRRRRRRHLCIRPYGSSFSWRTGAELHSSRDGVRCLYWPEPEPMCSWTCARSSITYFQQRFSLADASYLFLCLEIIHTIRWIW